MNLNEGNAGNILPQNLNAGRGRQFAWNEVLLFDLV